MSGLLSSLEGVSNALNAFSRALGAEQLNVSNSSTPGYAAQRAVIHPIGFGFAAGSGFDHVELQSSGSEQADALVRASASQASESEVQAQQLSVINQQFDITGSTGILGAFRQFSTAFANWSVTPGDASVAATALAAAGSVATAFRTTAQNLDSQRQSLGQSVQSTVSEINNLTAQIARLNAQLRGSAGSGTGFDAGADAARRSLLEQLASDVGLTVTPNTDGTVNVLAGGSIPLVLGDQAYSLSADLTAAPGTQVTSTGGGSGSSSLSGTLGGLIDTLNQTFTPILGGAGTAGSLNTLAAGFADAVNSILASGVTSNGTAGVPIFTYDTSNPANAARTLTLDPSVTVAQLAVATTGASAQSNGIANQLSGLTGSSNAAYQIGGLSAEDYFSSIAQSVGQKLSDAENQSTQDQTSLTAARANQTAIEGVSLDQVAVNITAYQRAWQASAKMIGVLDNLALDSVNLVGQQDT